jgi:hypothetical protein
LITPTKDAAIAPPGSLGRWIPCRYCNGVGYTRVPAHILLVADEPKETAPVPTCPMDDHYDDHYGHRETNEEDEARLRLDRLRGYRMGEAEAIDDSLNEAGLYI